MAKPFTVLYYHFIILTQLTELAFDVNSYQSWKTLRKHKHTPSGVAVLQTALDLSWWGCTDTTFFTVTSSVRVLAVHFSTIPILNKAITHYGLALIFFIFPQMLC